MSRAEQKLYDKHIESLMVTESELESARYLGILEGKKEGLLEGEKKGKIEGVIKAHKANVDINTISIIFELSEAEIRKILLENGFELD